MSIKKKELFIKFFDMEIIILLIVVVGLTILWAFDNNNRNNFS